MNFWRFDSTAAQTGSELVPHFVGEFGWLATLIGLVACLAIFPAVARVRDAGTPLVRGLWLLGGATVVALGYWAMEQISLLGFSVPGMTGYRPGPMLLSILPALLGTLAMIKIAAARKPQAWRVIGAALHLAVGLIAMHYVAMESLELPGPLVYEPRGLFITLLATGLLAMIGLMRVVHSGSSARDNLLVQLPGAAALGLAASAAHFTSMGFTHFHGTGPTQVVADGAILAPAFLIPGIIAAVLLLVGVFWVGSLIDARLGRAMRETAASEARLRAALDAMPDAQIVCDAGGTIYSVNPAMCQIYGYAMDELIGRNAEMLGPKVDRKWSWPESRSPHEAVGRQRKWTYPEGGRRKDGTTFPAEISVTPFAADGRTYYSIMVHDLSEKYAAELELKRVAAAVEQASDSISILDAERRVVYVNPQYLRQSGYSAAEVIGRLPFRGQSSREHYQHIWTTLDSGRKWSGQVRNRRKDGGISEEEMSVSPIFDGHGRIYAYVAVMRDISERLAAEARNRQLAMAVEHSTDSIEILDTRGQILYVNAAFEKRTGLQLADIRGTRPESVLDFGADSKNYQDMITTCRDQGRVWHGLLRSQSCTGAELNEEVVVTPVRDEQRRISAYVIVKRDVTERLEMQRRIQQSQKLEAVGQLAAGVAHEINTPTQYIGDNVRFLKDAFADIDEFCTRLAELVANHAESIPTPALGNLIDAADIDYLRGEIPQAIDQTLEGVERVSNIVRAMKEFSHPAQERTPTDLNSAIRSTITVATNEWKYVADVATDLADDLPLVPVVPGEFNQVVLNMLVNAAHAIGEVVDGGNKGKGTITVTTHRSGDHVEIGIRDTGTGMRPEVRARIFDPFYTTKGVGKGTGQGLAIAHDVIVSRHGGTIDVDSSPGHGSCFRIRLPLTWQAAAAKVA